jgi:hypothetical protein
LRLQVLLHPNLDATTSRPSWKELGTGAYLVSNALAGVLDAGKVLIDQTGAALRKAFGSARLLDHNLWPSATRAVS